MPSYAQPLPKAPEVDGSRTKEIFTSPFVSLDIKTFVWPDGFESTWECFERVTRSHLGVHGAIVFPVIKDPSGIDKTVLITQYRYRPEKFVLEIPAGLTDKADSDALDAALRELGEETGLSIGKPGVKDIKVISRSGPHYCDKSFSGTLQELFTLEITIDHILTEQNLPDQKLDEDERIARRIVVPIKELDTVIKGILPFLDPITEADRLFPPDHVQAGYGIDNNLGLVVEGLKIAGVVQNTLA